MRIKLYGLNTSSAMALSISQNGATLNDTLDFPTTEAGEIAITTTRTLLRVAPDSVGFEADLSAASFNTLAPVDTDDYDHRFDALVYTWSFDDPGTYSAPVNVLTEWKDQNTANGAFCRHMFTKPGNYTVTLSVFEPSSGKLAQTSLQVTVEDPDIVFAGPNTLCYSSDPAESVWDGAPVGCRTFTDFVAFRNAYRDATSPTRMLFKRGQTIPDVQISIYDFHDQHLSLGAFGTGDRPIMTDPDATYFYFSNNNGFTDRFEFRIYDISLTGNYDSVALQGNPNYAIRSLDSLNLLISNCSAIGVGGLALVQQGSDFGRMLHVHDTLVTDWNSYPIFVDPLLDNEVALTGVQISSHPDAPNTNPATQGGAPARINGARRIFIHGCDLFTRQSHSATVDGPSQPCLKLNFSIRTSEQIKLNVQKTSLEGGLSAIEANGASDTDQFPMRYSLFEDLVFVADQDTQTFLRLGHSGATIRNCLGIIPNTPRKDEPFSQFVRVTASGGQDAPNKTDFFPIQLSGNRLISLRDTTQNAGVTPEIVGPFLLSETVLDIVESANINFFPNATPPQTDTPLSITPLLWTPRNKGLKPGDTLVLDPTYATPANTVGAYSVL